VCFCFIYNIEIFIILRKADRDVIKMYIGFHVKYPLILFDFIET
jgi:hypothetical protein